MVPKIALARATRWDYRTRSLARATTGALRGQRQWIRSSGRPKMAAEPPEWHLRRLAAHPQGLTCRASDSTISGYFAAP